ncbi:MAG: MBL fold metallo-hydrolase [Acidimicrobiia bacterium]|nr:MBL fold metallo-hydrolase [Acidimicrobiia bacterium]MDH5237071.1 MBL fold metallo-hydrolase [Acidimicrobiia bacterium]
MKVTVLGNSGTYAGPGQACTGLLVQGGGVNVLLDCGPGVVANLQCHLPLTEIDAVVLTHSHPDHWLDFPVLRNALRYCLLADGIAAYGTADTFEKACVVLDDELAPTFQWTTIDPQSRLTIGAQQWRFVLTDHPVETLAPRVDAEGVSFAFSADTGPDVAAEDLGPDLDLFICEASLPVALEGMAPHVSGREAAILARAAGARRLVITHVVPGNDADKHRTEAEMEYGAPVEIATIGAVFDV